MNIKAILSQKPKVIQTSLKPYFYSVYFWHAILLSYIFDVYLLLTQNNILLSDYQVKPTQLFFAIIILAFIAGIISYHTQNPKSSLFIFKKSISSKKISEGVFFFIAGTLTIALVIFVASSGVGNMDFASPVSIGAASLALLILGSSIYKAFLLLSKSTQNKLPRNVFLRINHDILIRVIFAAAGILSSRMIGLLCIVALISGSFDNMTFILFELLSIILFFSLRPKLNFYFSTCPSCRKLRSIILSAFSRCPGCVNRKFYL